MNKNKQKWVSLCMMLAKIWDLQFSVHPFADYLKSGMWSAEFRNSRWPDLPMTGAAYGKSVAFAAKDLVTRYINKYGEGKFNGRCRIASEEELIANYEFTWG